MSDGIDFDLPVPPSPDESQAIVDAFDYDVAFNLAFVGVGQGGGRIAETFQRLGYRRVCAINTTVQDLKEIKLADTQKLDVGGGGASKDPNRAAAQVADKGEDIFDLLKQNWGNEVDYAFVCLGAAGGTGAGASPKVIEVARRLMTETKRPERVGAIIALPKDSEGQRPALNTTHTIRKLMSMGLSPVILIDNQRIYELYPSTAVGREHEVFNGNICNMLHLFNRLAAQSSEHTTFDRADFGRLLDAGVVAFGASAATSWREPADISKTIREQLKNNILASVDLTKGTMAALIYLVGGAAYDEIPANLLDHGVQMMTRLLAENSTVFQGIHRGRSDQPSLKIAAMVAGLPWPHTRLLELAKRAGMAQQDVASFLGV